MITDRSFNKDGSFRYKVDLDRGFRGDTILVNGAVAPRMKVERRLYRLRFLNASNARAYTLVLGNERDMVQIGSDGGLLPAPVKRKVIPLEPAERVDVIVDFRQFGVGSKVILHNTAGEPSTSAVMRFDVVRGGVEEARIPKVLRRRRRAARGQRGALVAADLPGPRGRRRRCGRSAAAGSPRCGSTAARGRARPSCGRGRTCPSARTRCTCTATTSGSSASTAQPPHPGDRGWKDTVAVLPNQTVVVRPYFDYFSGVYVFHCHAAEHGDMSMMGQMEVVA